MTPAFDPYVVPLTVFILILLFAVQSRGTANVAAFFGPVTFFWFAAIAVAGTLARCAKFGSAVWHSIRGTAVSFLLHHGIIGFYTLGAVFLVVTGAEALYADLGHFGQGPIRFAWLVVVLPALTINYLGQGALVIAESKIGGKSILSALPRVGAAPDGFARDDRDCDCQSGRNHGCIFSNPAGHSARLVATPRDPPHIGGVVRPNLYAACQYIAFNRCVAAGGTISVFKRAGFGLRYCGHWHDGGDCNDGDCSHLARLELAVDWCPGAHAAVLVH